MFDFCGHLLQSMTKPIAQQEISSLLLRDRECFAYHVNTPAKQFPAQLEQLAALVVYAHFWDLLISKKICNLETLYKVDVYKCYEWLSAHVEWLDKMYKTYKGYKHNFIQA